jgi:general secretion pathway protein J
MTLSRRSEQGFTLLEVLISVTLIALMAVALWSVMRISIRSWSRGAELIDTNQRHRTILDMVRKQIASAYNLIVPPDATTGLIPYPFFIGTETSFQFISLNSLQYQESPGLTIVTYEIENGAQGGLSLFEKESRFVGQIPDEASPIAPDRTTSVLDALVSCSFKYFDPGNTENPSQWVNEWDAKNMGRMPAAVSMTMTSRDPNGNMVDRQMVVSIQAASESRAIMSGGSRGGAIR